jgi:hypothetical protein
MLADIRGRSGGCLHGGAPGQTRRSLSTHVNRGRMKGRTMLSGCMPTHLRAALVPALAAGALAASAPAHAVQETRPELRVGRHRALGPGHRRGIVDPGCRGPARGGNRRPREGLQQHGSLASLSAGGTLDPSFDGDGIAVIPSQVWAGDVALQGDGKVLIAGAGASGGFTLARRGSRRQRQAHGSADGALPDPARLRPGYSPGRGAGTDSAAQPVQVSQSGRTRACQRSTRSTVPTHPRPSASSR